MQVTPKYYRVTDPVNQAVSKDVGWVIDMKSWSAGVQAVDGAAAIVRNESSDVTNAYIPKNQVAELSQTDFDALDVSGESVYMTNRRSRSIQRLAKLQIQASQNTDQISPANAMVDNLNQLLHPNA